jgi:hypothetical protein
MSTLFMLCAVVGGTLLACQSLLTLLGLGGHNDLGDSTDLAADHPDDLSGGHHGDGGPHHGHHSNSVFQILTFRAVVAALAFFGLAGLAARSAQWDDTAALAAAVAAGSVALWSVHKLMRLIARLRVDGTVRLHDAVGRTGVVYLRIPPAAQGVGKIQLAVHQQTLELSACSASGELATGQAVRVIRVVGPDLVEVGPDV